MYVRKAYIDKHGRTPGCPGCDAIGSTNPPAHDQTCRDRFTSELEKDGEGRERLKEEMARIERRSEVACDRAIKIEVEKNAELKKKTPRHSKGRLTTSGRRGGPILKLCAASPPHQLRFGQRPRPWKRTRSRPEDLAKEFEVMSLWNKSQARGQKEMIQLTSSRCAVSRGSHSLLKRLVAYVQEQAYTSRRRTRTDGSGISVGWRCATGEFGRSWMGSHWYWCDESRVRRLDLRDRRELRETRYRREETQSGPVRDAFEFRV